MSFESTPQPEEFSSEARLQSEGQLRESLFLSTVNEQLLATFEDALWEQEDIDDAEVRAWMDALALLDADHLSAFLAIPHESLQRRILVLRERAKHEDLAELVTQQARAEYDRGTRLAYHCSPHAHMPVREPRTGNMVWTIDGKEPDHRDDDIGMAYYSLDLEHLYRKKKPAYIYLIRADVGATTSHRQDNHGAWGRAPKLDVVTRINFKETLSEVETRVQAFLREQKKEA